MTEKIIIEENEYNIVKEDVDEIEYYEIISLDEAIKENPFFISMSEEEIYNELYELLKDKNKTKGFINVFYKTVDRKKNIDNFIINTDAIIKDYNDENFDIEEYVSNIKKLDKIDYKRGQIEKNKLELAINYSFDETKLTLNVLNKSVIELSGRKYILYKDDNVNIPINFIIYKIPKTTIGDFLYEKILNENNNYKFLEKINNDGKFEKEDDFFENAIPTLKKEYLEEKYDDIDFDYLKIENILNKYNLTLDLINKENYEILKNFLKEKLDKEIPEKYLYKIINIEKANLYNNKNEYYDILKNSLSLIENQSDNYELFIKELIEKNASILPNMQYNNIYDILEDLSNDKVNLEDISENIKKIKNYQINDFIIKTYNKNDDIENIKKKIEQYIEKYEKIKNNIYYNYKLKFIDFYDDIHDIEEAVDVNNYQGTPLNLNTLVFDNDEDLLYNDEDDVNILNNYNEGDELTRIKSVFDAITDKYEEDGFKECINILYPFLYKIIQVSGINIEIDSIFSKLFNKFSSIGTLKDLLKKELEDKSEEEIIKISNISPKSLFTDKMLIEKDYENIINVFKKYVKTLNEMIYHSIMILSINIQKLIFEKSLNFKDEHIFPKCFMDWSLYGCPYEKGRGKNKETGVLKYLCCVLNDVYDNIKENEKNIILPDVDKIYENLSVLIEELYEIELKEIREKYKDEIKEEKIKKGKDARNKLNAYIKNGEDEKKNGKKTIIFNKLLNLYIDALVYMPGVKYVQLHKFLLGCCMQKLDDNFNQDTYLKNDREDLLEVKKLVAKKDFSKQRKLIFLPPEIKEKSKTFKNDNEKSSFKIENVNTDLGNKYKLEEWLELNNENPLLTGTILNYIKTSDNIGINKLIEDYIILLLNTASYKKSGKYKDTLIKNINNYNYKLVLLHISKILKENISSESESIINDSITVINQNIKSLEELNKLITPDNFDFIMKIKNYICIRALCLPSNPDITTNKVLTINTITDDKLIKKISEEIIKDIYALLSYNRMPTTEENIDFMNKIRETNKNNMIKLLNKKTTEEREVLGQIKKILDKDKTKYLIEDNDEEINQDNFNDKNYIEDEIMEKGEDEILYKGDNDEGDDDNMEHQEFGQLNEE